MIPPRVILAPVDFSEPSRTALEFAGRLAKQVGAAVHVLHAQDPLLAEGARHSGFDLSHDTEEELKRFVAAGAAASGVVPRLHVATGAAADVIVQTAQRLAADLIVVGSHGMSGAERLVFGSVAEGVLRRAPVSVVVTPAQWTSARSTMWDLSGIGPVIAAVDFSPAATEAAKAACRLASTLETTLEILHVVPEAPILARWRPHAEGTVGDRVATARQQLDALAGSLACAAPVQLRVETGGVPVCLAEATATSSARRPILVLGRRNPGEKAGPPGSTAYRVLMLASVPVLMHVADQ